MEVIWHETGANINIFYDGECLVLSKSHPLYQRVKDLIKENNATEIRNIVLNHVKGKDIKMVESLLGIERPRER
jgi:hypothetical protein